MISGNFGIDGDGVYVAGKTKGIVIRDNLIGVNASGTTALPNVDNGIVVNGPGVTVGGPAAADRNVVSGNESNGILVVTFAGDPKAKGTRIVNNRIGTTLPARSPGRTAPTG